MGTVRWGRRIPAQTSDTPLAQVGMSGAQVNLATGVGTATLGVGDVSNTEPTTGCNSRVVMGRHPSRGNSNNMSANRRAKSQRRCDAWFNDRAPVEQKRKYRALLKGYRRFKEKCKVTDTDIDKELERYATRKGPTLGIPLDHIEPGNQLSGPAMDTERREMSQLIELLQEGGVGYVPKRKPTGWVRLMFENWNSLGIFSHSWKMERLNHMVTDLQVDIVTG